MIGAGSALEELHAAAAAGLADTVRVCFSDHYGTLRGRRIAVDEFLARPQRAQAFCDGALVWDVQCEIFEETDYSNFRTGYPDLHARPDLDTLRPCGWVPGSWIVLCDVVDHDGEPVLVDPRQALRRVLDLAGFAPDLQPVLELHVDPAACWAAGDPTPWALALAEGLRSSRVRVVALEPNPDEAVVALHLAQADALAAADALALARGAARELGHRYDAGVRVMARVRSDGRATRIVLAGAGASGERARDLALFRAPLPLAYPLGPGEISSDANPWLAVAAGVAVAAAGGGGADEGVAGYRGAIEQLRGAAWATEWFDSVLIHDALELADREARLREAQVSAWDLDRYGRIG